MVAISGIDGSGKTTVAREVVRCLIDSGCAAVYSRPKYKICKQFEFYLLQSTGDATSFNQHPESSLYASGLMLDWLTHSTDFLSLNSRKVIIMDRYVMDVLAQCLHFNGPRDHFEWFKSRMPIAGIEFFLDVPPAEAFSRLANRGTDLRQFESRQELCVLKGLYDELMSSDFTTVDRLVNRSLTNTVSVITDRILLCLETSYLDHEQFTENHLRAPLCPNCDSYVYP